MVSRWVSGTPTTEAVALAGLTRLPKVPCTQIWLKLGYTHDDMGHHRNQLHREPLVNSSNHGACGHHHGGGALTGRPRVAIFGFLAFIMIAGANSEVTITHRDGVQPRLENEDMNWPGGFHDASNLVARRR